MTMWMAWHGSEVGRVELAGGVVRVRFSAASTRHIEHGHALQGEDGFLRPLAMVFSQAQVQGDVGSALGSLAEGVLHHAGQAHRHLPLPFSLASGVHAELVFRNGTVLQIEARSVSCVPDADSRFVESMAC